MVEEAKTEETVKKEVEVKDFDFEKFLAQLGQENPDMSIIKEGVEKFGTGKLPDALKERFLKELFPHQENDYLSDSRKNMHKNSKCGKLGFEDVTGIKNVLSALKDLQTDGVLDQEQITKVMTAKYPKSNGKNMAMTLALNLRAAEFKWDKFTKPEDRWVMKHNLQSYSETLEIMGQINAKALQRALKEPYKPENINRSLTVEELSAKSEVLKEFMKDPAAYDAHLYVDGVKEGETEISGNDGLTVDGKTDGGLTVNTPKKEKDGDGKTATMDPQAGKDRSRREPFKFEKIKEQDIIQYMFENWLLEIMTGVIKAPFWVADKMLDALDSKYDTNIPASIAKGEIPKNVDAIKFLNDTGSNAAENCEKSLQNQAGYYSALFKTLKNNYGNTDFTNWKIEKFSDTPVLDVEKDKAKMEEFCKLLNGIPKETADTILDRAVKQADYNLQGFKEMTKVAGGIATALYLANNINGPFGNDGENKVRNKAIGYMFKFCDISRGIAQSVEMEYRIKNGLGNKPLEPKDFKNIYEESGKLFKKFTNDMGKNLKNVKDNLNNYYNAKNVEAQEITKRSIDAAKAGLEEMFSEKYLNDFLDENTPNTKGKRIFEDKKMDLFDLTRELSEAELRSETLGRVATETKNVIEGMLAENAERHKDFNEMVANIKGYKKFNKETPWVQKSTWNVLGGGRGK